MERLLYEASVEGNPTVLQSLLQKDPLILDKVTLNQHEDMPLHIASLLGHIDFVNEILARKPKLSMECDSQRRLPLHIASAKGHMDVVKALLSANPEACVARDRDGRNPLHLAAVKGCYEVVKVLVRAQPHAARAMVQQETILHLCVKHNQLEVLKLLIESMSDHEFVNTKDVDGNTILHLAVADKQIETINFLLFDTTIEVNASNINGEKLIDILAQGPSDMKDQQIMRSLTRAGAVDAEKENLFEQKPQNSINKIMFDNTKYYKKPHVKKDSKNNKKHWLDRKRNTLMVVASLIATMAFQAGTNPPSGVWQDNSIGVAGYAVMGHNHPNLYHIFLVSNTAGFVSSLSIILLLISGLPFLRHRVFLLLLIVIMWTATASMSFTYLISILVLTPKPESQTCKNVVFGIVLTWYSLVTLLVAGHTINGLMKIFRKSPFSKKKAILSTPGSHTPYLHK